jgi:hypothetical protein
VPSNTDFSNWYERQFGERVRNIAGGKGSPPPPPRKDAPPSGSGRGAGAVVGILVAVGLGIFRLATSDRTTPSFTVPTVPRFQFDKDLRPIPGWGPQRDPMVIPPPQPWRPNPDQGPDFFGPWLGDQDPNCLTEDDVPLLRGLCYRIDRERQQPQPTPGKQLWGLLDLPAQVVLRHAAGAEGTAAQKRAVLAALNQVLARPQLFDAQAFQGIELPPGGIPIPLIEPAPGDADFADWQKKCLRRNRALLESAYPRQIIPVRERAGLDERGRKGWEARARKDLEAARKQYEGQ